MSPNLNDRDHERLRQLLRSVAQGDVISVGVVNIAGRGPSEDLSKAGIQAPDDIWNLTVVSEIGWYVVLSQECDIVRDPAVEPCLVVCPVTLVSRARYLELRNGGYSPRDFPLPEQKLRKIVGKGKAESFFPVANQRFVTSVLKEALLAPDVGVLRPLTGRQQQRLRSWAGMRYGRTPHPDAAEEHVLGKAATIVAKYGSEALTGGQRTLQNRLVHATDTWLVRCSELSVTLCPILTLDRAKAAGMLVKATGELDAAAVAAAARKIGNEISAAVTRDCGFRVSVEPRTWESMSAGEFTEFAVWVWENQPDPLLDEAGSGEPEQCARVG